MQCRIMVGTKCIQMILLLFKGYFYYSVKLMNDELKMSMFNYLG